MTKLKATDNERKLIDKWIKELSDKGCTPEEMIAIFRRANEIYKDKIKCKIKKNENNKI
ncbi:MAG: hypothetical protein QM642_01950 [Edaphocola sp.]